MKETIAWCVIAKTQPIVVSGHMPVYYTKKQAKAIQKSFGGKVIKVVIKEAQP